MNINFKILNNKFGLNSTIVVNILSAVVLQGIAFISSPIFTRVLGTEQFGLYAIYNTWCNVITCIICLGTNCVASSGHYYFKNEYFDFRNCIIVFSTAVGLFSIFILLLLSNFICQFLNYSFDIYIILLLTCLSSAVIACITNILIYEKKAFMNLVISIILSFGNVLISLILILSFNFKNLYYGRVYGHFVPYFVVSLFLLLYVIINKPFIVRKKYCIYALTVGSPIVFHTLSHIVLGQSDRVMMEKLGISISDIGVYSLFYTFSNVLTLILNAFNTSFAPFYMDDIDSKNYNGEIKKSKNYIEIFTLLCIGFLLLSREVSYILGDESFMKGIELLPFFVLSVYFVFMYHFPVNFEFYYLKTKTVAVGTICAAIINILLNFVFIPKYGMFGAAFTTLVSYIFLYIFHYIIVINLNCDSRYQMRFKYFIFGFILVLFTSVMFYLLKNYIFIRWGIGIFLGIFEIKRVYIRKTIF